MIRDGGIYDETAENHGDACEGGDADADMRGAEAPVPKHNLRDQRDQQEHGKWQKAAEMRAHTAPLAELPERIETCRVQKQQDIIDDFLHDDSSKDDNSIKRGSRPQIYVLQTTSGKTTWL